MILLDEKAAASSEISRVCPRKIERNQLWSLWDMLRFNAAPFIASINGLTLAFGTIQAATAAGLPADDEFDRRVARKALEDAAPAIAELPLSRVLRSQFDRLRASAEGGPGDELPILMREFYKNLVVELTSPCFLMIPVERREFYEQKKPAFGDAVIQAFPDAWLDIAAASRCLALDEWTACVFHLMRVLEHGLRALAEKVGLPPEGIALSNWKNVIDQIEKKIKEIESEPKSLEKSKKMRELSELATQFRYFKDAWRNHVSHSRANYDEGIALSVWTHVREFMRQLAASD